MRMKHDEPKFAESEPLARYIAPEYRQGNRRPKVTAFMEESSGSRNGLSVNSVAMQSEGQIAQIYSEKFESRHRPVALTIHIVSQYNEAAAEVGILVSLDKDKATWTHQSPKGVAASYKFDPKPGNPSHCLVAFTTAFTVDQEFRFARRMAFKPTFKEY